jgi:ArsR family transcriptional regulator
VDFGYFSCIGKIFQQSLNTTSFEKKAGMEIKDSLVMDAHVLFHPIRFRIVELLAERQMYINELSNALGEDRRHVSYHLRTLEEYGFVSSKYEISDHPKSRGKALKKYWVNGKVEGVISELREKL